MSVIPNLWPSDIKPSVVTPRAILLAQAGYLNEITRGVLSAEVETSTAGEEVTHLFTIVAPALDMYRHVILTAQHGNLLLYPVTVASAYPLREEGSWPMPGTPRANDDAEFMKMVGTVLRSPAVRAVINSLIARTNETSPDGKNGQTDRTASPAGSSGDESHP